MSKIDITSLLKVHHSSIEAGVLVPSYEGAAFQDLFLAVKDDFSIKENTMSGKSTAGLWGRIFDYHYGKVPLVENFLESTSVWKSSYTGELIPEVDMKEWVEQTVRKILPHINSKSRVLEVGCGNGLILKGIKDHLGYYIGLDSSEQTIEKLKKLFNEVEDNRNIHFYLHDAIDINNLPEDSFDFVIVNSVIQYFGSTENLLSFINKLRYKLSLGAMIYFGDVRSYEHREFFYWGILMNRFKGQKIAVAQLKQHLKSLSSNEKETLYSIELFKALPLFYHWIKGIRLDLRRGVVVNEMNQFRFDVFISSSNRVMESESITRIEWNENLRFKVVGSMSPVVVHRIPNHRILYLVKSYDSFLGLKDDEFFEFIQASPSNDSYDFSKDALQSSDDSIDVFWDDKHGNYHIMIKNPSDYCWTNVGFDFSKSSNSPTNIIVNEEFVRKLRQALPLHEFKNVFLVSQDLIEIIKKFS